ncbi:Sec-independent protein translocase protein TatB [Aquibium oceanicum]|uniref:Sec-independent protein translocase protein TatB n=1 Tax=Aquibium oceanicum TaxID=1670800 RepID=A0A1L3SSF5_9HYPH|nr:Sec-independent protein translocase protein TatB [Aquibium oceanicum]APH72242.1 twin arginine-targeting protein translocase TatB [Aquibium oceanicum]
MFDIGWPEMLVIAVVLIVVVGPKDLPRMLRQFGKTTSQMRKMAGDFRKQFDEALKEAELDDVKSTIDSARKLNPAADIRKALNPMEKAASDVRAGLDGLMKPKPADIPAPDAPAKAEEPAKSGATAGPGNEAIASSASQKPAAKSEAAKTASAGTAKSASKPATAKQAAASASAAKSETTKSPAAKSPAAKSPAIKSPAAKAPAKPAAASNSGSPAPRRKPAAKKTTGASS